MKILYAGDSPAGGPANYLLGILRFLNVKTLHLPPDKKLKPSHLKTNFDAIILSDFSKRQVSADSEKLIMEQVEGGTGFMMVGGWGSFSGPFGGWHKSRLEKKILPVRCLQSDDRLNFPGGAQITVKNHYPMLRGLNFKNPPVIVGLNKIIPNKNSRVILAAKKIISDRSRIALDACEFPLLVIDSHPKRRVAAFATDFAPHWCGGLVDWGSERLVLPVQGKIRIEIGNLYLRFAASLIAWLAGR